MASEKLLEHVKDETGLTVQTYNTILDGWDNHVIEVNDDLIFRFTRRKDTQQQHIKELELLPVLKDRLTLRVPNPVYVKTSGDPPYYMGYKRIPGKPLTGKAAEKLDQDYLVETIAGFLDELQDTPISLFNRVPVYTPEKWSTQYRVLYNTVMEKIAPKLEQKTVKAIQTSFNDPLNKSDYFDFIPALIHRDLTSDHILYSGDKITGVIDWGDACFGDPAFDLTGFVLDYSPAIVDKLTAELDVPDHCLDRVSFYAKVSCFYECIYGLETGLDDHVSAGLEKIKKSFN